MGGRMFAGKWNGIGTRPGCLKVDGAKAYRLLSPRVGSDSMPRYDDWDGNGVTRCILVGGFACRSGE